MVSPRSSTTPRAGNALAHGHKFVQRRANPFTCTYLGPSVRLLSHCWSYRTVCKVKVVSGTEYYLYKVLRRMLLYGAQGSSLEMLASSLQAVLPYHGADWRVSPAAPYQYWALIL